MALFFLQFSCTFETYYILNLKLKVCLIFVVFGILFSSDGIFAQKLTLELASKDKNEQLVLNKIDFQKKHKDTISIFSELLKITTFLKSSGYFTTSLNSLEHKKNDYKAFFSLNEKVEKAILKIKPKFHYLFDDIKSDSILIDINTIERALSSTSKKLDKEGKSFSKVKLNNISIRDKILYADVVIRESERRFINKVIVKGYEKFPKSFIKNYFNIKNTTFFNQQKIEQLSNDSKNLQFIEEIKPPEVLFTKDSTLLYMYLKKIQNNSFDGIVNFNSKDDGGILLNGNIDLRLNNILNKGENFNLFWNSIGEERQEFRLTTETPYLFNSKFTPKISFSIYRQDSTFLNTKLNTEFFYNLNSKSKIALSYSSESSKNLEEFISSSIKSFHNYFLGFKFQYKIAKSDIFFNDKFYLEVGSNLGRRTTNPDSSNQFKIETSASYIWDISKRNSIFVRNTTGILNSDTYLNNELFRIGGPNSIRGFNEQSIFTNKYTYFNIEYRYLTSIKSYLHTISDFGSAKVNSSNILPLGVGIGYLFLNKNSLVNISYAISKTKENSFNLNNSQVIIKWVNYF